MKGIVIENKKLNDAYFLMTIECPDFVEKAKIGQFLMIKAQQESYINDPLLRRPFGICDIDNESGTFKILYTIIGKGTQLLSTIFSNTEIHFSEPLGNVFKLVKNQNIAIVAGGVGVAPLLWLTKSLHANGNSVTLFFGGRSSKDIVIADEFKEYTSNIHITTNDGSLGVEGLVTIPLQQELDKFDKIYTCGPRKMLQAVTMLAVKANIPVDVSLDERMACGIGACLGCIVYVTENGKEVQKRCCVEGPIFDGNIINWDKYCK